MVGTMSPATRRWIRAPTRVLKATCGPPSSAAAWEREATMPPGWSPGVAFSGTVIVNGTTSLPPAATSTVSWISTQVPMSSGSTSGGRMSNTPLSVTMPSEAMRSKV